MSRLARCDNGGCAHKGVVRQVRDVVVAPGVVTRPALYCAECGEQMWTDRDEVAVGYAPETAMRRNPRRPRPAA